jgi:hypothetical protein
MPELKPDQLVLPMNDTRTQVRLRPVIRVFVSSTFSDMKHERNALAAEVYPKLEELCQKNGFQFHAIDLRFRLRYGYGGQGAWRARQCAVSSFKNHNSSFVPMTPSPSPDDTRKPRVFLSRTTSGLAGLADEIAAILRERWAEPRFSRKTSPNCAANHL